MRRNCLSSRRPHRHLPWRTSGCVVAGRVRVEGGREMLDDRIGSVGGAQDAGVTGARVRAGVTGSPASRVPRRAGRWARRWARVHGARLAIALTLLLTVLLPSASALEAQG